MPTVIDAIGMRAHGPLALERFGDGELEGWSAMQFIETSSITIHADEFSGRCFIDVFSCRAFDPEIAAAVAVAHFGGTRTLRVLAAMTDIAPVLGVLAGAGRRRGHDPLRPRHAPRRRPGRTEGRG